MDKEKLLFEMYKDTVETGSEIRRNELQKKYPDVNISNLHIRIVNHQIKKYGQSLNNQHKLAIDYKMQLMKRKRENNNGRK